MTQRRLVHDADGLNTAAMPADLAGQFETPVESFFTRSHAPIPAIDPLTWRLDVAGLVGKPMSLSLAELRSSFPRREVAATLVCAGIRRDELLAVRPLPGELPWGPEPVSSGRWAGVSLRDVLQAAGLDVPTARHIEFVGADRVERRGQRFGFGGSIEVEKALDPDVLLAFELNDQPLPRAHGFPMRAVVPGWVGARSVKWLVQVNVAAAPSENYFQTHAYRIQRHPDPMRPADVTRGTPLCSLSINAVILDPAPDQAVGPGPIAVRGWAIGADSQPVTGVEVSVDGGVSWVHAALTGPGSRWTWTLWNAALTLPAGRHTIMARATDASGVIQPELVADTWNVKGYLNNAWHRVEVTAR